VRVWRIATAAHADCDGEGARLYGSRWTPKGLPAVFASATLSLAALERLAHTDPDLEPTDLISLAIDIGPDVAMSAVELADLPYDWRDFPAPARLALFGQRWLQASRTAVLSVPSVFIPHERNFILDPAHADFEGFTIGQSQPFGLDPRVWRRGR
jgi:RES domain-containing protein